MSESAVLGSVIPALGHWSDMESDPLLPLVSPHSSGATLWRFSSLGRQLDLCWEVQVKSMGLSEGLQIEGSGVWQAARGKVRSAHFLSQRKVAKQSIPHFLKTVGIETGHKPT